MWDRDYHVGELEKLVKDNRVAFERAKRLLAALREQTNEKATVSPDLRPIDVQDAALGANSPPSIQRDSGLQSGAAWLDLERMARIEVTSEAVPGWPISSALSLNVGAGWRSKEPGMQTIRLIFGTPRSIQRIQVVFVEADIERTQEFVLRWLPSGATDFRDIVRQQYVFSPRGSTREIEDYQVDLKDLAALQLCINPDLSADHALASLANLSLA